MVQESIKQFFVKCLNTSFTTQFFSFCLNNIHAPKEAFFVINYIRERLVNTYVALHNVRNSINIIGVFLPFIFQLLCSFRNYAGYIQVNYAFKANK